MHVGGITVDPNWFLQLIVTLFVIALGILHLVKNTASKYFEVDANFDHREPPQPPSFPMDSDRLPCAVCGNHTTKKCSRCKSVRYCSAACQQADWRSGHKTKCKANSTQIVKAKSLPGISLIPCSGTSITIKKPRKVLFPYDEFVKLFNWDKPGFVPCGLLNCGNSCFANVVLQCLVSTRPLVAYLLENGHRRECRHNDWCFLCEFQTHVERASQSSQPFSPINILSRLPNIGGNLGYGRQEDAHEFMRFAIDTMQSVCLDEFGGEKAVDPSSQETTLIQHIFGGHLQSQVMCTKCTKISNQYENMMDLTVEIHGDASSLEECLDQFTVKEWLHGDNMYKCDGCNDYVKAWKRLTVRQAPNILTIALKRFQSGRFGKLNKKVSFPEKFNLSPYMSEENDGVNVYRLYAVVVHVDMLNASFFGHYICYTKDFCGNWYRIDDCKVTSVELEEVLSQGAYMLLYSRESARPTSLRTGEGQGKDNDKPIRATIELGGSLQDGRVNRMSATDSLDRAYCSHSLPFNSLSPLVFRGCEIELPGGVDGKGVSEQLENGDLVKFNPGSSLPNGISNSSVNANSVKEDTGNIDIVNCEASRKDGDINMDDSEIARQGPGEMDKVSARLSSSDCREASSCDHDPSGIDSSVAATETLEDEDAFEAGSCVAVDFVTGGPPSD